MIVPQHSGGPIKSVRVPKSDVDSARDVEPPRHVKSEQSRQFAVMGAAILEKLCRSGSLKVKSKRTTPYIIDTVHGKVAVSVMVSAITGDPSTKHLIIPATSLNPPPGVVSHVVVCAFVSKLERSRETNGGLNVRLAGWATDAEARKFINASTRLATRLEVASIPVSELHPIQTLRLHLSPPNTKEIQQCENHV